MIYFVIWARFFHKKVKILTFFSQCLLTCHLNWASDDAGKILNFLWITEKVCAINVVSAKVCPINHIILSHQNNAT